MFLTFAACLFVLRLFQWYVTVQHTPLLKAALTLAIGLAALKLALGRPLPVALAGGAVAGVAAAGLVWVDRRFHSLASIPVWLVLSLVLAGALVGSF